MKIISGGQSGADLAGNYFAKKYNIETEINAEKGYKPLYDPIPADIKINIVSQKFGNEGGWIERRKYNIQNSDFTIILLDKDINFTRGSLGTYNDCLKAKKDFLDIDINIEVGSFHDKNWTSGRSRIIRGIDSARRHIKEKNPEIINIAGQRDLDRIKTIEFLEKLLL